MLERAGFPSRTRQRRLNEKRTRLWFEAAGPCPAATDQNSLPGGHSEREPPDPIPNSEVKTLCADGSVPFRHARVGYCQAPNRRTPVGKPAGVFCFAPVAKCFAQEQASTGPDTMSKRRISIARQWIGTIGVLA